jgi:hypothetical protein
MANDLLSALRTYLSKISAGEKTPQEMAAALNAWARESGEAIKQRVEEEVARSVKKMGFAKQEELDRLTREVEALKSKLVVNSTRSTNSSAATKSAAKNASAKKSKAKASAGKTKASTSAVKKKSSKSAPRKAAK